MLTMTGSVIMTTLCYIEHEGCVLLLHRTRKSDDINKGKWIGVGGKFMDRESPEECLLREVKEETGLRLLSWRFRGIITFIQEGYPTEFMCLYTSDEFEGMTDGSLPECPEGELAWIPKEDIGDLPMWEGDKIFLDLINDERPFFSLKLEYSGDELVGAVLDGTDVLRDYQ